MRGIKAKQLRKHAKAFELLSSDTQYIGGKPPVFTVVPNRPLEAVSYYKARTGSPTMISPECHRYVYKGYKKSFPKGVSFSA